MYRTKIHLGLRTVKTALAVTLALTAAELVHSTMPIFSAIGAISAMSRTLGDALTACLTQLAGCVCGCLIGLLFLLVRKSADWRIPVAFLAAAALYAALFPRLLGGAVISVKYELLSGSLIFCACYLASDPCTSPRTKGGKWMYGALAGFY